MIFVKFFCGLQSFNLQTDRPILRPYLLLGESVYPGIGYHSYMAETALARRSNSSRLISRIEIVLVTPVDGNFRPQSNASRSFSQFSQKH